MRASGCGTHKALVRVDGLTLLEWNLRQLLEFGFNDIAVAVSAGRPELHDAVLETAQRLRSSVTLYEEPVALGNIGAARETVGNADALLVMYVDNLAAIDLRELVNTHVRSGRAMTIATHREPWAIPFGELIVDGDEVTDYVEKPTLRVQVSSGTCVLSRHACETIPPNVPTAANQLFSLLRAKGERVGAYHHDAPWIDVNDLATIARAESLVRAHAAAFAGLRGA